MIREAFEADQDSAMEKLGFDSAEMRKELKAEISRAKKEGPNSRLKNALITGGVIGVPAALGSLAGKAIFRGKGWGVPLAVTASLTGAGALMGAARDPKDVHKNYIKNLKEQANYYRDN